MSIIKKYGLVILMIIVVFPTIHINQPVYSQQIVINRIEQMPNLPSPYEMRDWENVTIGYDSFVFDFNLTGQYLPLIWWRTNTINYPHISFGLHTVVGTLSPWFCRGNKSFTCSY